MSVKNHGFYTVTNQYICTGKPGGPGTNNSDLFIRRRHPRHVWSPAHLEGGINQVFFNTADGDGSKISVEGAGTFTEAVLRADPATDFRQAVSLMAKLGCLNDASLIGKLQPVGDIVMDRTLPFAVRITAGKTAISLHLHLGLLERMVNFHKFVLSLHNPFSMGINPINFDKLE